MNPNSLGGGQQPTSSAPRRLLFAGGSAESKARSTRGSPGPHPGPERRGAPRHPRPLRFPGPEASGLPNHQPLGGPPIPGYSSGDTSRGALGRGELAFRAFPRRQGPRPEAPAAPGAGELEASSLPPGLASALLGPRDKVKKRLPRAPAESPRGAPGEACGGPKRLKAEPQAVEKWALGPMGDHPLNRCPAPLGWPRPGPKETPSAGPDARARPSQELLPCRDKGAPQDSASAPPPSFARGDLPGHSCSPLRPALPWTQQPGPDASLLAPKAKAPEGPGSPLASVASLACTVARTSEEKYSLLNYRDKLLRQAQVKRTDLEQAKPLVGTCPDMCPEKERYMRESRKQLSIFETLPGSDKVDHGAAIKEYSRSSADQEEPLAHELRPSRVLSMTMDYLVTHIMDRAEGTCREWYDFVWNRTRGLRKDITQQHLCDPLTVSLIEKCARFHIHCAHQLCEEPAASFDAEINGENMSKCLQSVKEMHQDLAGSGRPCAREAEFRSYDVLLHLRQGDILREVQQFQAAVRTSPEITFATQALSALNSNNFVKFFKLVRAAPYLEACILHSYFGQVRRDALRALSMAYTASSQRPTFFPLYDLVRMLLFRDCAEAEDFVSFYGLHVSDGWVELNRTAFRESERVCKPTRSALIRQKRSVSVGEVINGGPLPSFVRHVPVGSFNAESVYVGESLQPRAACRTQKPAQDLATAPAQGKSARSMGTSVPPVHPERMPALPPLCPQSAPTPQPQPRPEPPGALHPLGMSPHSSGAPAPAPSPFRVVQTVLPIQRNGAAFSERDAGGALPERDGVVREESRATRGAEAASRGPAFGSAAEARRVPEELCASLLALFVEEEISGAAQDVFREFRCFHKCLWQWKKMVLAQKKWKRHVRAFPPAPCYVDQAERLKALLPSAECPATRESLSRGVLNLGHAGRLGISCTRLNWIRTEMIHQMKVQYFYQNLLSKAVWSPLDWPSLLSEHLSFQHGPVFWKLVLVLPRDQGDRLDEPGRTLAEWVKVKFTGSEGTTSDRAPNKVQTLSVFSFPSKEGNCRSRIHGSVQVVDGPLSDEEFEMAKSQKVFFGTSGLVLLLPCRGRNAGGAQSQPASWLSVWLQLRRLLLSRPVSPLIPLLVLVPFQGEEIPEREVEEGLRLPDFIARGLISEYMIVEIPGFLSSLVCNHQLSRAVRWLVSCAPRNPGLCCQTLAQFVEDGIQREFYERFCHDQKERRLARLPPQEPGAVVALYNSVLAFLATLISAERLSQLSWPDPEFARAGGSQLLPHLQWNEPAHLAWLKAAVLSFQIPPIALPPLDAPWSAACSGVFQYAAQIPSCGQAWYILQSELDSLLHRSLQSAGRKPRPASDIPWDGVLSLCINHRLRDWAPAELPAVSGAVSNDGQMNVYFYKDHLRDFVCPVSWEQARLRTQRQKSERSARERLPSWRRNIVQVPPPGPESEAAAGSACSADPWEAAPSGQKGLPEHLLTRIQTEKEESKKFEDRLCCWLSEKDPSRWAPSRPPPLSTMSQSIASVMRFSALATMQQAARMEAVPCGEKADPSLSKRLRHLEELIQTTKKEDEVYKFHLATLRDLGEL